MRLDAEAAARRRGVASEAALVVVLKEEVETVPVERDESADAETVTGPTIRMENGLFNPPVRYNSNPSCSISNSTTKSVSISDKRLFSAKTNAATRLLMIEMPMTRKHRPISRLRS